MSFSMNYPHQQWRSSEQQNIKGNFFSPRSYESYAPSKAQFASVSNFPPTVFSELSSFSSSFSYPLFLFFVLFLIGGTPSFGATAHAASFSPLAWPPSTREDDIVLGVCRVPFLDQPERLTGLMVAIDESNRKGLIPNHRIRAEIFYYPHCANGGCNFEESAKLDGLSAFIGNMSRFHAVLFPHFNISDVVIDAAKAIGLPVIDPNTIRESDYELGNLFLMEQTIETEISVVIRYMLMAHSCARTGIVHDNQPKYADMVAKAFVFGTYAQPRILSWPSSQEVAREFFFGDSHQKCIFFLTTSVGYMNFMGAVYEDERFVAGDVRMFSWSQTSTSVMRVGNTSAPFTNFYFPKVITPTHSDLRLISDYKAANDEWFRSPQKDIDVATHYRPSETVTSNATTASGLMWYFRSVFAIKLIGHAISSIPSFINATNRTLVWEQMLFESSHTKIWASDFPFFLPIRSCPPKPLPQICSCNIVTRVLYMLGVEGKGGTPYFVVERPKLGETNVANVALSPEKCVFKLSVSSYPFRILTLQDNPNPTTAVGNVANTKVEGQTDLERLLFRLVVGQNFADPAPIRPWRLVTEYYATESSSIATTASTTTSSTSAPSNTDDAVEYAKDIVEIYKPFFLLGSSRYLGEDVGVLSAFSDSSPHDSSPSSSTPEGATRTYMRLTDPHLVSKKGVVPNRRPIGDGASSTTTTPTPATATVPLDNSDSGNDGSSTTSGPTITANEERYWTHNLIHLEPVLADYVHALAYYFAYHQEQSADLLSEYSDSSLWTTLAPSSPPAHFTLLPYSELYVIASSQEEMALIVKSLHTFQIPTDPFDAARKRASASMRVSMAVVTNDPAEWAFYLRLWGGAGMIKDSAPYGRAQRPFILAATANRVDIVSVVLSAIVESKTAVVGLATADVDLHDAWATSQDGLFGYDPYSKNRTTKKCANNNSTAKNTTTCVANVARGFPANTVSEGGDLIFVSPFSEYWGKDTTDADREGSTMVSSQATTTPATTTTGTAGSPVVAVVNRNPLRQYLETLGVLDALTEIHENVYQDHHHHRNNSNSNSTSVTNTSGAVDYDGYEPTLSELLGKMDPRLLYKAVGFGLAHQLSLQAAINFKTAAEILYTSRTASVGDVSLGPFSNDTCDHAVVARNDPERTCQCSKGIRQLRVHSFYNKLNQEDSTRTTRLSYTMATCGVKYSPLILPPEEASSILATVLLASLLSGVGLLTVLGVASAYFCCFTGRNNRKAPKDSSKPFSIAFTDIQASTTLWSRCPSLMSDAVELHCEIIRRIIYQHDGYEVKTIGDSFMVAFGNAEDAVRFALEVQDKLYKAEWPAELDQHYREIIEAQALETHQQRVAEEQANDSGQEASSIMLSSLRTQNNNNNTNNNVQSSASSNLQQQNQGQENFTFMLNNIDYLRCPNAPAEDNVYRSQWNGIRVRVGINHGLGECRKDPVTLGYDYYGTIVNTAARVEGVGHGGQILITDTVLKELPYDFYAESLVAPAAGALMVGLSRAAGQYTQDQEMDETATTNTYASSVTDNRNSRCDAALKAGGGLVAQKVEGGAHKKKRAIALLFELGPQHLRGLDDRVLLYQLLPNAPSTLCRRQFPPLRLDVENVVAEGGDDDDDDGNSNDSDTTAGLASNDNRGSNNTNGKRRGDPVEMFALRLCEQFLFKGSGKGGLGVGGPNNNYLRLGSYNSTATTGPADVFSSGPNTHRANSNTYANDLPKGGGGGGATHLHPMTIPLANITTTAASCAKNVSNNCSKKNQDFVGESSITKIDVTAGSSSVNYDDVTKMAVDSIGLSKGKAAEAPTPATPFGVSSHSLNTDASPAGARFVVSPPHGGDGYERSPPQSSLYASPASGIAAERSAANLINNNNNNSASLSHKKSPQYYAMHSLIAGGGGANSNNKSDFGGGGGGGVGGKSFGAQSVVTVDTSNAVSRMASIARFGNNNHNNYNTLGHSQSNDPQQRYSNLNSNNNINNTHQRANSPANAYTAVASGCHSMLSSDVPPNQNITVVAATNCTSGTPTFEEGGNAHTPLHADCWPHKGGTTSNRASASVMMMASGRDSFSNVSLLHAHEANTCTAHTNGGPYRHNKLPSSSTEAKEMGLALAAAVDVARRVMVGGSKTTSPTLRSQRTSPVVSYERKLLRGGGGGGGFGDLQGVVAVPCAFTADDNNNKMRPRDLTAGTWSDCGDEEDNANGTGLGHDVEANNSLSDADSQFEDSAPAKKTAKSEKMRRVSGVKPIIKNMRLPTPTLTTATPAVQRPTRSLSYSKSQQLISNTKQKQQKAITTATTYVSTNAAAAAAMKSGNATRSSSYNNFIYPFNTRQQSTSAATTTGLVDLPPYLGMSQSGLSTLPSGAQPQIDAILSSPLRAGSHSLSGKQHLSQYEQQQQQHSNMNARHMSIGVATTTNGSVSKLAPSGLFSSETTTINVLGPNNSSTHHNHHNGSGNSGAGGEGGRGDHTNNNNNTSSTFTARDYEEAMAKAAAVAELTSYYHFFCALLSTSAEPWRKDLLKHLAKRWRTPHPNRIGLGGLLLNARGGGGAKSNINPTPSSTLPDGNNTERMRCIMHIALKSMVAVRGRRAAAAAPNSSRNGGGGGGSNNGQQRGGDLSSMFSSNPNLYSKNGILDHQNNALGGFIPPHLGGGGGGSSQKDGGLSNENGVETAPGTVIETLAGGRVGDDDKSTHMGGSSSVLFSGGHRHPTATHTISTVVNANVSPAGPTTTTTTVGNQQRTAYIHQQQPIISRTISSTDKRGEIGRRCGGDDESAPLFNIYSSKHQHETHHHQAPARLDASLFEAEGHLSFVRSQNGGCDGDGDEEELRQVVTRVESLRAGSGFGGGAVARSHDEDENNTYLSTCETPLGGSAPPLVSLGASGSPNQYQYSPIGGGRRSGPFHPNLVFKSPQQNRSGAAVCRQQPILSGRSESTSDPNENNNTHHNQASSSFGANGQDTANLVQSILYNPSFAQSLVTIQTGSTANVLEGEKRSEE